MTAKLREIKTDRTHEKEEMLDWLDQLRAEVEDDKVVTLITIAEHSDELVNFEIKGASNDVAAIGMIETSKQALINSLFCTHHE